MEPFKVVAPTRADLAGGTLDIWPLYCLVGEAKTINVALDLHATASFTMLPGDKMRIEISMGQTAPLTFQRPLLMEEIQHLNPIMRFPALIVSEYLRQKNSAPKEPFRIRLQTEAPLGGSLGGSSSLCVAMVRGLSRIYGDFIEQGWQWDILRWIRDVEAAFLKLPTGTQDTLAALFGGLHSYISRVGGIHRDPYPDKAFQELSQRLLVLYSGESHHSGLTNWEVIKAALDGEKEVLAGLTSSKQVAEELDKELRATPIEWSRVGHLLDEEWAIREATFHVETKRLKEIVRFLKTQAVLGCKVCGAAGGGSLIAIVDPERKKELEAVCENHQITVLKTLPASEGVTIL